MSRQTSSLPHAKIAIVTLAVALSVLLGLAVTCRGPQAVQDPLAAASPTSAAIFSLTNWMGLLSRSSRLSQLSIPGSHDSAAQYEPISGTAICQALTITEQLNAGVRFLDIRCRHLHDAFAIHHGAVYQNLDFKDVMDACIRFLEQNPTECVIMSVKEEYEAAGNTRPFEQTFDAYATLSPRHWSLGTRIPTLGDTQGKIVLLRRFSATSPKGIDATRWADNRTFAINTGTALLRIQDHYVVPDVDEKWTATTQLLSEAQSGSADVLFLNFTSGYKPLVFGIPSIPAVSNAINPKVEAYFSAHTSGRFGIIISDFADAHKSALIIETNF